MNNETTIQRTTVRFRDREVESPTTYKILSDALGVSIPSLRNIKQELLDAGLQILRPNRYERWLQEHHPDLTEDSLEDKAQLCKVYANNICLFFKMPIHFPQEGLNDATVETSHKFLLESYRDWKEIGLSFEEYALISKVLKSTHSSWEAPETNEEEANEVRRLFQSITGHCPDEEQVTVVHGIYDQLIRGPKFGNVPYGVVQSVAGASKTTCSIVAAHYIKQKTGKFPWIVTFTNKARIPEERMSVTIARFVNVKLQCGNLFRHDGNDSTRVLEFIEALESDDSLPPKEPMLIVDEFSLVDENFITILKKLAERIVFIGDLGQLSKSKSYPGTVILSLRTSYRWLGGKGNAEVADKATRYRMLGLEDEMRALLVHLSTRTGGGVPAIITGKLESDVDKQDQTIRFKSSYKGTLREYTHILNRYKDLDSQVIAYANAACNEVNMLMNDGAELKVGSKVMVERFNPAIPRAVKGTIWLVSGFRSDGTPILTQELPDDYVCVNKSSLALAFCITTHKAQGSQWENALIIAGTANRDNRLIDSYVSLTRAVEHTDVIYRANLDDSATIISLIMSEEFQEAKPSKQRNAIHVLLGALSGVTLETIIEVANDALQTNHIEKSKPVMIKEPRPSGSLPSLSDPKCQVVEMIDGKPLYRPKKETTLTLAQAKHALKSKPKGSYIAMDLDHSNMVVIDCDSESSVNYFKGLADVTEAWISPKGDSMHLVFKADTIYNTKISHKASVDFLGNNDTRLRALKPNKKCNDREAVLMTKELYEMVLKYQQEINNENC